MRRALASAAALLVAACHVDVEGAICHVPGATAECPAGQACGNDGRCSARALACETAGTRCEPGSAACAGDDDEERVERCTGAVDPVCGSWAVEECTAAGLRCGTRSGEAGCECPAFDGAELAADPVAGSRDPDLPPFPTGAASPASCRFGRLGDALDAARDALVAHPEGTAVRAYGAGGPLVFGDVANGETFPLTVVAGVTLRGAVAPAGPTIVRAEGATGTGISAVCGAAGKPRIEDLTLDGGGSLTRGIDVVAGSCGAALARVNVSGVNGPALALLADTGVEVAVTASSFRESAVGVYGLGGRLVLGSPDSPSDGVEASGNAAEGILLKGASTRTLDVEIYDGKVMENGGTGVMLDVVSTASRLTVRRCDVYANGRDQPRKYGPDPQRVAGGILIRQSSLSAFAFDGNRLWSNARDQLAFETSGTAWSLASGAASCGPASNLFACVAETDEAIGIGGLGTVKANYSVWPGTPWDEWATSGVYIDPESAWCTAGTAGAPAPAATCPAP
jgi:hypothetical protein